MVEKFRRYKRVKNSDGNSGFVKFVCFNNRSAVRPRYVLKDDFQAYSAFVPKVGESVLFQRYSNRETTSYDLVANKKNGGIVRLVSIVD